MQLIDGRIIYAASDLTNYLECDHLVGLEFAAALRELIPPAQPPDAELAAQYGRQHEEQLYRDLREQGYRIAEIPSAYGLAAIEEAAESTLRRMRDGATHIAQATFFDGNWLGRADLLVKVDRPSALGAWSYEVLDAKLARRVKPYAILQVCFYSDQLARLQELEPELVRLYLGTGQEERLRLADFVAYYRRIKSRFEALVAKWPIDGRLEPTASGERGKGSAVQANSSVLASYPDPVSHCAICRWSSRCEAQRESDDHLSLVAGMRRDQIAKLEAGGVTTTAALARAPQRPAQLAAQTFETLRHQAALQVRGRETGQDCYDLLRPEELRGLARLPKPSAGDVFFDMEGHPYVDGGLEYLFGIAWRDEESGALRYRTFWAHDHLQERQALQAFVQFIDERRKHFPDLHLYHYAHYEPSALKRLMTQRGTCEDEIDDWLRRELFVDLYQVVRQGLRASRPGYGLKEMEHLYGFKRVGDVAEAMQSVRKYEEYLATGDHRCLDEIETYNRQDCISTMELHDWLLTRRDEAERTFGKDIPFLAAPTPREESSEKIHQAGELQALKSGLLAGIPEELERASGDERTRWLLAQLLDYHRREAKPVWWAFFDRFEKDVQELVEDSDAISDLRPDERVPPQAVNNKIAYRLRFPPQQYRLAADAEPFDPATQKMAGTIAWLDDATGELELRRSKKREGEPLPRALIPGGPIQCHTQEGALRRFARAVIDGDAEKYRANRDILARNFPRIRGLLPGDALQGEIADSERTKQLAAGLDESYLFIQGPPGSGKTYTGARLAVHLMKLGKRVGIASNSHKAIHNLLHEIEEVALAERCFFRGLKKSTEPDTFFDSKLERPFIDNSTNNADFVDAAYQLIAGTAWLFARGELDGSLDYLFVDEAGQVSLADALAMGTSTRNIVLLGDPLQLGQVSQAAHPDGAGASVLEHLLGDAPTIPPERGVFLEHTRRLHPAICAFIAEIVYAGRLRSAEGCDRRSVASPGQSGAGVRFIAVEHGGNSQKSPEEAAAVADALAQLLRGTFTDDKGARRQLTPADVLVVTPYNMQVRCLKEALRERGLSDVRVGTVDKFQGQQAAIVFYSLATSSGEDLPRNLEFLFSRNRLNVAISRAQALAILVASPRLLDIGCKTVDQLQMVNALCRFVELAAPPGGRSDRPVLDIPEIGIDSLRPQPA